MVQYTNSLGTTARIPLTLIVIVGGVCAALALMPAAAPVDAAGADDFVTVWRATASDKAITIPVGGSTGSYDVDWGDGSTNSSVTGDISHTYDAAGNYTVRISGDFTRIAAIQSSCVF
ncbi:MAG: PKD domain-containing protein [Thaumarchaeota archaeon]|nr:PKD domain-containing protein [Nitrososphaerota archaeon]